MPIPFTTLFDVWDLLLGSYQRKIGILKHALNNSERGQSWSWPRGWLWGSILSPWAGVETTMFWPFQQTNGVLATVEAFWPHWLSEPEGLFFLTNPSQLNTGTKTLLLVETLSPINGELGPCRQYWLLLLFCRLRPSPTTSYPTAGITLTSSHAHGGLESPVWNENQFYKCVQFIDFNIFDVFSLAHLTHVPGTCI